MTTEIPVTNRTGGSNAWATPRDFVAGFRRSLGLPEITLDLAAGPGTALCPDYFGPGGRHEDALTAPWEPLTPGLLWLNPPYSRTCRYCSDREWKGKRGSDGKPRPAGDQCAVRGHRSSTIADWVAKASQVGTSGQAVALLVPARVDTDWFHEHIMDRALAVYFVHGRHRFLAIDDAGELSPYKDPAAFPTMLVLFDGRPPIGNRTLFGAMRPDGSMGQGSTLQMMLV